jgi:hypothetical protein
VLVLFPFSLEVGHARPLRVSGGRAEQGHQLFKFAASTRRARGRGSCGKH